MPKREIPLGGLKDLGKLKETVEEEKRREMKELFDTILRGKFDKVPEGNYQVSRGPVESITLTKPQEGNSVHATIFYKTPNNKESHITWSVFENGSISGKLPKDLTGLSYFELQEQILRLIERIDINFWHGTNLEVLPLTDIGPEREVEPIPAVEKRGKPPIDPKRLNFLENQPSALFGFYNKKDKMDEYFGELFPSFVILEHHRKGNAAFIIDLAQPLSIDQRRLKLPPSQRIPEEDRDVILERSLRPLLEKAKSKKELKAIGAKRIVHTPETWQERMQSEIKLRLEATEK